METTKKIPLTEEETNNLIDLMESDTLEGRTAKLLSKCPASSYVEQVRQMMCVYITSEDFNNMSESGKNSFIWETTLLIEYLTKLD